MYNSFSELYIYRACCVPVHHTELWDCISADSPTSPTPQNMGSLPSVNLDAILRHTFIPDYTIRAITEVFYVRIKRSLYLAAKRATLMERAKKGTQGEDHFDDEVEKVRNQVFRFI
jgi:hypothetical protein